MLMRHPKIRSVIEVPDDPHTIAVHRDGGWVEEPDPVQHHPALAPGETAPEPEAVTSRKRPKTEPADAAPAP